VRLAVVVPTLNEAAHVETLVRRLLSGLDGNRDTDSKADSNGGPEGEPTTTSKDQAATAYDRADLVVVADGGSTDATLERLAALQAEFEADAKQPHSTGEAPVPSETRMARGSLADEQATNSNPEAPRPDTAHRAPLTVIHGPAGRGIQQRDGAAAILPELDEEDLLVFVHADNLPEPGALAALQAAAARGGNAFAMRQHVDAEGDFYRAVERYAERRAARGRVYGDSCLAVRAGTYRAVGGFRPLPLFEDLDLARRLAARGPIVLVDGAYVRVCARRWQKEGKTVTVVRNWLLTRGFELRLPPRLLAAFYPRHS